MAALLDEFPKIRLNFNLVPSLLQQLDDYAQGKAHEKCYALSLKPASSLSFEEHVFILENFFMANWSTMIDPEPRYAELLDKRGRHARGEELARTQNYFKEQDWRDLQVWFNLAWFDPYWSEKDPFVRDLKKKGKNFTEEEKKTLLEKQLRICGEVAGKHRELQDRGQIEITASPFYHPIIPLLCDTDAARVAMPQITLPHQPFRFPEDARMQIQRAMDDHAQRFGKPPRGMWPSEGSVSDAAIQAFTQAGLRWIATDEAILANSLPPNSFKREDIYQPYKIERDGKTLALFFRDHELSDAIGFVYTSWDATDAVNDFMKRLQAIRIRLLQKPGAAQTPYVVPIILDGENCWEYYKEDGLPFLRKLYQAISDDSALQTVLASDYLEQHPPERTLPSIWSGSWIHANYAIWIGHREDNQAWDLLQRTRHFLTHYLQTHPDRAGSPEASLAWEEIYIAEGSDWCWWYGDDHSSANDGAFDSLFRKHLMNVYTALGEKIPDDLRVAIKPQKSKGEPKQPVDFITPKIDGKVSGYFEWQAAGVYEVAGASSAGTMHRAQNMIKTIYYGYDLNQLYYRVDFTETLTETTLANVKIKLLYTQPSGYEATILVSQKLSTDIHLQVKAADSKPMTLSGATVAAQKILEFSIPLSSFATPPEHFEWSLAIEKEGQEIERWPSDNTISHPFPAEENFAQAWMI